MDFAPFSGVFSHSNKCEHRIKIYGLCWPFQFLFQKPLGIIFELFLNIECQCPKKELFHKLVQTYFLPNVNHSVLSPRESQNKKVYIRQCRRYKWRERRGILVCLLSSYPKYNNGLACVSYLFLSHEPSLMVFFHFYFRSDLSSSYPLPTSDRLFYFNP